MKVLICDYIESAEKCKRQLEIFSIRHMVNVEVKIITSFKNLLFYMDDNDIDLVILEYRIFNESGIKAARQLRKHKYIGDIIFYTLDREHIADGYEVDALNYFIKDKCNEELFFNTLLKSVRRSKERNEEFISLFCAGERRRIDIESIVYFEVNKRIVTVHYGKKEVFEFYSTLSKIDEMLAGKGFVRIHQSYLISRKYIDQKKRNEIIMKGNIILPVGRSYQGKI